MAKKEIKRRPQKRVAVPKNCFFCEEKKEPTYRNPDVLSRFLTERGKIIPRSRSGLCAKHQRHLTSSIKHARHLALLPFVGQR